MENRMETLTAFLKAHWQLVLLKGGLHLKTILKTERETEWKMEWKHWQLSLRHTDSFGGGGNFNTKYVRMLRLNGFIFCHKFGPTLGVFPVCLLLIQAVTVPPRKLLVFPFHFAHHFRFCFSFHFPFLFPVKAVFQLLLHLQLPAVHNHNPTVNIQWLIYFAEKKQIIDSIH